jgi:molybdopterin-guanine dinucleotide biosynthesis protein
MIFYIDTTTDIVFVSGYKEYYTKDSIHVREHTRTPKKIVSDNNIRWMNGYVVQKKEIVGSIVFNRPFGTPVYLDEQK